MKKEEFLKSLTIEQRAAVENIEKRVSVTANAGSGKTTMMVTKYLYLLLFYTNDYTYKNIAAITFTKKAASEILAKIRNEINKLVHGEYDLSDEQIKILNDVNRNLMSLNVGTIHSFCRRIVRDFGYKIGLQSNLKIIDEIEKEIVLEKLIHNELSSETAHNPLATDIKNAIFYLGFADVVSTIKKMIGKKNYFEKQKKTYNKNYQEFCNELIITNNERILDVLKPIITEALSNYSSLKIKEENIEAFEEFRHNLETLEVMLIDESNDFKKISDLAELITQFRVGKLYELKKIISKESKEFIYKNYNRIYYSDSTLENRYNLIKSLVAIGEKVSDNYRKYSIENNVMDNDDTINYAVDLLKYNTVRRLMSYDVKYLMIDEFQDTDDRQLEIAESLTENDSVHLFVVGDDKQSIYSFRDADVRVFKNFRETNNCENLKLNVSFRAVHHLNSFVNNYFKNIMNSNNSLYDVDYQEITSSNIKGEGKDKFKEININFSYNSDVFDKSNEIMALKSIYDLLNKGVKYNEICVLSRSSNDLLNLSNKLNEYNIPSYITSSKGFFNRNEIKDLIAYLQFIDNPDNDLLLAATLKSAMFNYSDKMLFDFKTKERDKTFWKFLETEKLKGNNLIDDKTYDVISKSIKLSNKLPITNLVMKIVDESNWNYYYNNSEPEREAVYRNLYKFMDFIRAVERRDYTTLSDLFLYLDKMFENDRMSEEYGNTSNSICMSTIHSAKGLEYKHLILLKYQLQPGKSGDGDIVDENYGPSFKAPKSVNTFDEFGKSKTFIDDYIERIENTKQYAENIRLSYVAMTRAANSIDIISPLSSSSQREVWEYLRPGMAKEIENQKNKLKIKNRTEIHKKIISEEYTYNINCYDVGTKEVSQVESSYRLNFDFSEYNETDFDFSNVTVDQNQGKEINYIENFDPIDAKERYMQFTATKLNKFIESKKDNVDIFKEVYVYGLPNITERLKLIKSERNQPSELFGTKYGSLFHNVMEKVNRFTNSDLILDTGELKKVVFQLYDNETNKLKESSFRIVKESVAKLLKNDFVNKHRHVLLNSNKEFELKSLFGTHILHGEIDVLSINNETATIWDWKTNNINSNDEINSIAANYELQMKLYALLVFKYDPKITEVNTNLLFVRNISKHDSEWIVKNSYKRDDLINITIDISKKIGDIDSTYGYIYPVDQTDLIKE